MSPVYAKIQSFVKIKNNIFFYIVIYLFLDMREQIVKHIFKITAIIAAVMLLAGCEEPESETATFTLSPQA